MSTRWAEVSGCWPCSRKREETVQDENASNGKGGDAKHSYGDGTTRIVEEPLADEASQAAEHEERSHHASGRQDGIAQN